MRSVAAIQSVVTSYFDLSPGDLTSRTRTAHIAWARQVAMYLARERTRLSLAVIGEAFKRDYGTVLHACRAVRARVEQHADAAAEVADCSTRLQLAAEIPKARHIESEVRDALIKQLAELSISCRQVTNLLRDDEAENTQTPLTA